MASIPLTPAPGQPVSVPAETGRVSTSQRRLVLVHLWIAFAAFLFACLLGTWQMWARSPLQAPAHTAENYFQPVTMHGVSMAYVLTTFFIMGFGYYVGWTALRRPLPGLRLAWIALWTGVAGVVITVLAIASGAPSVLYTFYPPMTATPWFYVGLVLVVGASWIWCGLMIAAMVGWKRENPGAPVPLAMFATMPMQKQSTSRRISRPRSTVSPCGTFSSRC